MVSLEIYFVSVFAAFALGTCIPLILIRRAPVQARPAPARAPTQAHAEWPEPWT